MRRIVTLPAVFACLFLCRSSGFSAALVQWDFNSAPPDADTSTGVSAASVGIGTISFIGGALASFGTVAGGAVSDPAEEDDSQMRITRMPAQGSNNKGVGIELELSTLGYENLRLSWDQYNSATASRYWRVLFTTDGITWSDHQVLTQTTASVWMRQVVELRDLTVNNRSALGLRIVPEFESTATGTGADEYIAVRDGSNYGTSGTWWIDHVTISGRVLGVSNAPPVVSPIGDITLVEWSKSDPIEFSVSDAETAAEKLSVTATTSSSEIITNLVLTGTGSVRQLVIHSSRAGEASIMIRVLDEEGDSSGTSFNVVVLPAEDEQPAPHPFVYWAFNSPEADGDVATGTLLATGGAGELQVIGASASSFGSVAQGRTSDPAEADNSMLRITGFPRQATSNEVAGLEFRASTLGFGKVELIWDHYNSATASRYWKVQYTTNGTDFTDHVIVTNSTASTWLLRRRVTFENVPGAENNPQFGVRIVSSFSGGDVYEAVSSGSNYGTTGTLWLDMIGLTGRRIADQRPPISYSLSNEGLYLFWPKVPEDYVLEVQAGIGRAWQMAPVQGEESEGAIQLLVPLERDMSFFRLRKKRKGL